ncbi:hypothetical protein LARV_02398 [Longilinea arvoryzae]|uniref:Glycosyltransferase RgtA/B/C/D-like domain-containing protein n=1 Tax=Longilinea arvoryzae TaxID=360412 RepID=A0A0S7BL67_9CHLR|nr:hypothetical protein [Longilinea arvoryzae]GAP14625.1 hypothetical protein LARV_02398 [Longilinea arvoryzae]
MIDKTNPGGAASRHQSDRLVLVLILLLVFLMAARTPLDTDLWWHLRAGETTLQNGQPMLTDTLSYTRAGSPWINHSWLAEVGMALLFRTAGYLGLCAAVAFFAAASMAILYRQMEGPALLRAFIILLATLVAAVVWTVRPQILSLVLLAVCGLILDQYRRKGIDRLWLLPPVFVLWSNLHGGYPLGLLLIGAVTAGEVVDGLYGNQTRWRERWLRLRHLLIILALCELAVVINPNGLSMWKIPFQTVGVGVLQKAIPEWASPDFHDLVQQPFLWMLLLVIGIFSLAGRRIDGADWMAVVLFGAGGLMARRNFGPFAMVSAPILARYTWEAWQAFQGAHPGMTGRRTLSKIDRPVAPAFRKGLNLFLAALIGFVALIKLFVVSQPQLVSAYEHTLFPVDAVAWLQKNPQAGSLFNSYAWGGYLAWAYPEKAVFLDGRTDLFGDEIIDEWLTVTQAGAGWQKVLQKWQVRTVLLEPDQPVTNLLAGEGWKLVYQDATAVIYRKEPAR